MPHDALSPDRLRVRELPEKNKENILWLQRERARRVQEMLNWSAELEPVDLRREEEFEDFELELEMIDRWAKTLHAHDLSVPVENTADFHRCLQRYQSRMQRVLEAIKKQHDPEEREILGAAFHMFSGLLELYGNVSSSISDGDPLFRAFANRDFPNQKSEGYYGIANFGAWTKKQFEEFLFRLVSEFEDPALLLRFAGDWDKSTKATLKKILRGQGFKMAGWASDEGIDEEDEENEESGDVANDAEYWSGSKMAELAEDWAEHRRSHGRLELAQKFPEFREVCFKYADELEDWLAYFRSKYEKDPRRFELEMEGEESGWVRCVPLKQLLDLYALGKTQDEFLFDDPYDIPDDILNYSSYALLSRFGAWTKHQLGDFIRELVWEVGDSDFLRLCLPPFHRRVLWDLIPRRWD